MEKHGVVPNIIDVAPKDKIKVLYPSGVKVKQGNELTPLQVKDEPKVEWNIEAGSLYTLVMIDPDAPSRRRPETTILHWLVGNIPGNDLTKGIELASYIGSGPPEGSGLHRYIFLVYKQSGNINFDETPTTGREGRRDFDIRKFVAKYGLGNPVAGNLYQAQFDEYVRSLRSSNA